MTTCASIISYHSYLSKSCLDCPTGCASCQTTRCTSCLPNYYYSSAYYSCTACPSGTFSLGGPVTQCSGKILNFLMTCHRMLVTMCNMYLAYCLCELCSKFLLYQCYFYMYTLRLWKILCWWNRSNLCRYNFISFLFVLKPCLDCPAQCASCISSALCTSCQPNYYFSNIYLTCTACPSGTYSPGGTALQCISNTVDYYLGS